MAQRRVNLVGRWVASQTSRPGLPWTFGVIDTPEINAFAAPGGYVLVTRGLYEILATDSELAAVLSHEISHCVERDHYNVIRRQEMASSGQALALQQVNAGTDTLAGQYARNYVDKHGAVILLTSFDREAEYRSVATKPRNPLLTRRPCMAQPTERGEAVKKFDQLMGLMAPMRGGGKPKPKPRPTQRGQAVRRFDELMGVGGKPPASGGFQPSVLQERPWSNMMPQTAQPALPEGFESRSEGWYTPPELLQMTQQQRQQQQPAPIHPEQGERGLGNLFSNRTFGGGY